MSDIYGTLDADQMATVLSGPITENQAMIYANNVWHTSEFRQPLGPFQGSGDNGALIEIINDLAEQGGKTYRHSFVHPLQGGVYKMDYILHGTEEKLLNAYMDVSLVAWRKALITSKLQQQLPKWQLWPAMLSELANFQARMKATHILECLLSENWNAVSGPEMIGPPITNDVILHAGVFCSNQIIAGNNSTVEGLSEDDVFIPELIGIAKEVAYSGYRRDGEKTFRFKKPVVAGQTYDGVCFHHPFQKHDLRWHDPTRFEQWLLHGLPPGLQNPIWAGIGSMYVIDNVLMVELEGELADLLLFDVGHVMKDEDGNDMTARIKGARAIFCGARAAIRATGIEKILDIEKYDGSWFGRMITGAMEGVAKTQIDHPVAHANRDMGVVQIFTAASHHNIVNPVQ
jgi:hypothetical protein